MNRDSRPSNPSIGIKLAVCGKVLAACGGSTFAITGGASTTFARSTVSPVGATASTGAVFRVSTGAEDRSIGVARTGVLVIFASSMALALGYTNSWPQFAPG